MYTVADIVAKQSTKQSPVLESEQTISVELSLWEAAEILAAAGGRALPVVQDGKVVGMIRRADLITAMQRLGASD